MDGLMGEGVPQLLQILKEMQFGKGSRMYEGNQVFPPSGQNPVAALDQMIMSGAGGNGMAGRWQNATGQPVGSFQGAQQQAAPQQQMQPQQGAPMPELPPALQALMLQYMEEAKSFGITDPGEVADYAAAMMAAQGQGQ